MKMNSHPNSAAAIAHYRQLLTNLLSDVEAEVDEAGISLDSITRELHKMGKLLLRIEPETSSVTGKRLVAASIARLKQIIKLATAGGRHASEASGSADQAYELFRAALLSVIPDDDSPPSLGPEVGSVVLDRTILDQAGEVTGYEFRIDGFPYRFPRAAGRLLKALCEDRDGARGRYVPFKSQASLERSLGVTTTWLHTQVNRLRNRLESQHGFPRKLVETDRAEGYRLRLVRPGPGNRSERE